MLEKPETDLDSGEGKTDFQAIDNGEKDPLLDISKTVPTPLKYRSGNSAKLEWEKVNEITWKLTNGEQTNVPASHGQWAGYRTSKAIAWVINIAPNAWLARCGDQTSNPSPLNAAKSEAMAMAKGACGDYEVTNSIAHLNGLTAILLDRA